MNTETASLVRDRETLGTVARVLLPTSTLRNAARAVLGSPLFVVQHLTRLRHITRTSDTVLEPTWSMPADVAHSAGAPVQPRADGCGPVVVRRYSVGIDGGSPTAVISHLLADPNALVPQHVAGFMADGAPAKQLRVGDELVVEIPGPWNGPVRVESIEESSLVLVTLDGHMEAGHIEFRVIADDDHERFEFAITSWARAGDALFEFAHVTAKVAAELQLAMWVHTCDRAVRLSGGTRGSRIRAATEILEGTDIEC